DGVVTTETETHATHTGLSANNGYWVRFGGGSNSNSGTAPANSVVSINLDDLDLPPGATLTNLTFSLSGGSGNADLYVRRSNRPATNNYTCRPSVASNNNEICSQSSNLTGTWYAAVR